MTDDKIADKNELCFSRLLMVVHFKKRIYKEHEGRKSSNLGEDE